MKCLTASLKWMENASFKSTSVHPLIKVNRRKVCSVSFTGAPTVEQVLFDTGLLLPPAPGTRHLFKIPSLAFSIKNRKQLGK